MNARTAREALLAVALDEVDSLLARTQDVSGQVGAECARLERAVAALDAAAKQYAAHIETVTAEAKTGLVAFVERKVSAATAAGLEAHRKSMQEAATLAFAEQLAPAVRDVARQLEQHRQHPPITKAPRLPHLPSFAGGIAVGLALATLLGLLAVPG